MANDNGTGENVRALKEENRLLEVELELAQKGTPYIVLNTSEARILLKNKGILLREFKIDKVEFWARNRPSIEALSIIKKKAFSYPKRKEIVPHKQEEGSTNTSAEIDFLELKDMPSQYTLLFGGGLSISVRSKPEGRWPKLIYVIRSVLRHISHSFALVWSHLLKKDYMKVELVMVKEEAQGLYWTAEEGMPIVIYHRICDECPG